MYLRKIVLGAALAFAMLPANAHAADSTISVQLLDITSKPPSKDMSMVLDLDHVAAGTVTFHVKNLSKVYIHEMVVVPVTDVKAVLPYDKAAKRIKEDELKALGEVSELKPGKSGDLTVTLAPGTYRLVCNVPDHFHHGMWVDLTVTP